MNQASPPTIPSTHHQPRGSPPTLTPVTTTSEQYHSNKNPYMGIDEFFKRFTKTQQHVEIKSEEQPRVDTGILSRISTKTDQKNEKNDAQQLREERLEILSRIKPKNVFKFPQRHELRDYEIRDHEIRDHEIRDHEILTRSSHWIQKSEDIGDQLSPNLCIAEELPIRRSILSINQRLKDIRDPYTADRCIEEIPINRSTLLINQRIRDNDHSTITRFKEQLPIKRSTSLINQRLKDMSNPFTADLCLEEAPHKRSTSSINQRLKDTTDPFTADRSFREVPIKRSTLSLNQRLKDISDPFIDDRCIEKVPFKKSTVSLNQISKNDFNETLPIIERPTVIAKAHSVTSPYRRNSLTTDRHFGERNIDSDISEEQTSRSSKSALMTIQYVDIDESDVKQSPSPTLIEYDGVDTPESGDEDEEEELEVDNIDVVGDEATPNVFHDVLGSSSDVPSLAAASEAQKTDVAESLLSLQQIMSNDSNTESVIEYESGANDHDDISRGGSCESALDMRRRGGGKLGRRRKRGYIYDPKPLIPKTKTISLPSDLKDEDYWDRRKRNNEAAKRSRENRRVKELETMGLVKNLTETNEDLHRKIKDLELRNKHLEDMLSFTHKTMSGGGSAGSAASSDL